MKKICIITQCSLPIPTTKGGAVETLVEYLINENEIHHKYEITVVNVEDDDVAVMAKKYRFTNFVNVKKHNQNLNKLILSIYKVLKKIRLYIPFSLEFKEALKKISKMEPYDLYVYEAGPTTQLKALSKIIPKNKLVVHIHWDGMSNPKKDKCFSYLIPVSEYIGNQWKKGSNRDSRTIVPLHNCAKIELFSREISDNEKKELRKSLGIPEKNRVVIFTGRIVEEKGIRELLQAIEILKHENVTLLVIGSANFGAKTNTKYEKTVNEMIKLSEKSIIFTGYIHQTELYKYYNIADIAVIPSLFQDPAPLVCIETQATGTPLIATNVGGIPEYVDRKGTILVENDADLVNNLAREIDNLLENDELRKRMGVLGKKNSLKYNTRKYYEEFCNIIDEIDIEKGC